jgi:predicted transcriptional regulator
MAAFCRKRGLSAPQFYWWRKRLGQVAARKFVEVKMAPTAVASAMVLDPAIEIHLAAGCSLRVRPGFDADHLRAVLAVLEPRS